MRIRRPPGWRAPARWSALLLACSCAGAAWGQGISASDNLVRAAFVYNFAKFTEWPAGAFASAQAPLQLCIAASRGAISGVFDGFEGKLAQGRPIRPRHVQKGDDLGTCHILYVSDDDQRQFGDALRAIASRPVLTVGDADGFAESGGIIGLIEVNDKIGFEVNVDASQRSQLKISSQLLRLAKIVKGRT